MQAGTCGIKEINMEWKIAFDRIMDQLYNHPEEMRYKLLGKYNPSTMTVTVAEGKTAIEMLQNVKKA